MSPRLTAAGVRPRRGQVTMVAGQPGAGKTLLVLHYATKADVGGLYISADTDAATVRNRLAAMATGMTVAEVEDELRLFGNGYFDDVLAEVAPRMGWVWEPAPTPDDISMEVLAYEEVWGDSPELIVVDNLMNVVGDADEFTSQRETMKYLHHLARKTRAGVFVLHHTVEGGQAGRKPPNPAYPQPRRDVQGKVAQLPELILTVGSDGFRTMRVAAVKNRNGPADPEGKTYTELAVNYGRMAIYDSQAEMNIDDARRYAP